MWFFFICPVQFLTIESSLTDIFFLHLFILEFNVIVNSFHKYSNLINFLWFVQLLTTELDFIGSYIY